MRQNIKLSRKIFYDIVYCKDIKKELEHPPTPQKNPFETVRLTIYDYDVSSYLTGTLSYLF